MPGKVIGISFNYGYPGTISRMGDEISRTRPMKAETDDIYFGDPVIVSADGTTQKFGASDTAAAFAGVAMRKIKGATQYLAQNRAFYTGQEPVDILERGGVTVNVNVGTPTIGGAVYIRTVANAGIPAGVVGGFEAAADGTNTIQLTNAKWATLKDANSVAELTILTRQSV
ncbi:hypothetical protein SOV_04690 [Sporomusa ovata DSM 2662]|uniref:Putative bacteriophage protein n=1 Tax=Sporomusa ovata TaxID=2378 RepID=A0A0U1KXM2_9FIRM|nr:hypothetical protein [Sporomusa ovata]EQB28139.1 hypothetical protein SOV_2c10620 [Sporomusa ovata DSM 2662]CQR71673.1 putative bacteriophage protein [Sporomusa ovata]